MGYTYHDMYSLTALEVETLQLGYLVRQEASQPESQREHDQRKAAYRRHFGYE